MLELNKVNDNFPGKKPLFFEMAASPNMDLLNYSEYWTKLLQEIFSIDSLRSKRSNDFYTHPGILVGKHHYGIICIALKDQDGSVKIYCNNRYFEINPSHKKYINVSAKNLGLSVRKDIVYISDDLINTWISKINVTIDFYKQEIQDKMTEEFFGKMRVGTLINQII